MNTFHSELLSNSKEGVEVILGDVDLTMVHEVQNSHQLLVLDTLQVEKGMLVLVSPENRFEEGRAGGEYHLVGEQLVIVAGEGNVEKIFVISKLLERSTDVGFKVVPTQTKLVCCGRHSWLRSHRFPFVCSTFGRLDLLSLLLSLLTLLENQIFWICCCC